MKTFCWVLSLMLLSLPALADGPAVTAADGKDLSLSADLAARPDLERDRDDKAMKPSVQTNRPNAPAVERNESKTLNENGRMKPSDTKAPPTQSKQIQAGRPGHSAGCVGVNCHTSASGKPIQRNDRNGNFGPDSEQGSGEGESGDTTAKTEPPSDPKVGVDCAGPRCEYKARKVPTGPADSVILVGGDTGDSEGSKGSSGIASSGSSGQAKSTCLGICELKEARRPINRNETNGNFGPDSGEGRGNSYRSSGASKAERGSVSMPGRDLKEMRRPIERHDRVGNFGPDTNSHP